MQNDAVGAAAAGKLRQLSLRKRRTLRKLLQPEVVELFRFPLVGHGSAKKSLVEMEPMPEKFSWL